MASPRGIPGGSRGILVCQAANELAALRGRHCNSGPAHARICRGTSPQAQTISNLGPLRIHQKPSVFGKRVSSRRVFGGEPLVDFHTLAGSLPCNFLSCRNSAGASGTQDTLRRRICGIRITSPCFLAAPLSRNGVEGTIFLAPLPAKSRVRSGRRPRGRNGNPVDYHDVEAWGVVKHASACWVSPSVKKNSERINHALRRSVEKRAHDQLATIRTRRYGPVAIRAIDAHASSFQAVDNFG